MDYPEKQGCCFWKEVVFFRLPELFLKKRIEKVSFLFHLTRTELNKNPNYLVYRVSNRTTLSDTDPGIVPIWATSASFVCVNKATLASGSDIGHGNEGNEPQCVNSLKAVWIQPAHPALFRMTLPVSRPLSYRLMFVFFCVLLA